MTLTAHALAKRLLELPDVEVIIGSRDETGPAVAAEMCDGEIVLLQEGEYLTR